MSHSKDGIIKVWSFAGINFPSKSPTETICDHESKIRCGDCFEDLLGTFDSDGKVTIRSLNNPQECIQTLNISDVTKNQQICLCDSSTLVVTNSTALELYNTDGKFINMIDLEDKISFIAVQGIYILAGKSSCYPSDGHRKSGGDKLAREH